MSDARGANQRHTPTAVVIGGHRVLASALLIGPELAARTVVASRTAVAQRIDARSVLVTVLSDSAAVVTRDLAELVARSGGGPPWPRDVAEDPDRAHHCERA